MKAKMFRSVEMSDIPSELQDMLRESGEEIKAALDLNLTTIHVLNLDMNKPANIDCVSEALHNTRLMLAEVDKELSNVADIIGGYKNYIIKTEEEEQRKRLLQEAITTQEMEQHRQPIAAAPSSPPSEQSELTKEMIKKIAEMSNADEG